MGVDFSTCSKCGETFPDCGPYAYCEVGHYTCPNCMPSPDAYEMTGGECPVCTQGGTEVERLRARCARLEGALRELIACKDLHDSIELSGGEHEAAEYKRRKPLAWARARGAVGPDGSSSGA